MKSELATIKKISISHSYDYFGQKILRLFLGLSVLTVVVACQTLPIKPHLITDQKMADNQGDNLDLLNQLNPTNPIKTNLNTPLSGYYPLATSANAFASRNLLIGQAQRTIDVQYYIWHDDQTGQYLLQDLYNAANRGVKVRLLLDDLNTTPTIDQTLLAFAKHPNIDVRIVNPKPYRRFSALNYLGNLPAINRRMHNKSMTFDNQISIVGGRNIGDEYLRNDKTTQFADLDVLLAGKVVKDIDRSFDSYWQSSLSYDVETLISENPSQSPLTFWQRLTKLSPQSKPHAQLVSNPALSTTVPKTAFIQPKNKKNDPNFSLVDAALINHQIPFRWVPIQFFSDPVEKLSKHAPKTEFLVTQLRTALGKPSHKLTIVSSYFVPTALGIQQLASLVKSGVQVKILTNSYASTDVGAVHSGYAETRRKLLKAGVALYELKTSADPLYQPKSGFSKSLTNSSLQNKLKKKTQKTLSPVVTFPPLPKNISLSLHTKAFAIDNDKVFIGSYNIDPRSANINTELGVVIEDPLLASGFHDAVGDDLRSQAYQVVLSPTYQLQWLTLESSKRPLKITPESAENMTIKVYQNEPNMSAINQLLVRIFGLLPFNWML